MQVTRVGEVVGTPMYMAPEQLGGAKEALGPHSDVFSLGVILFEILTLQPYRKADSLMKLMRDSSRRVERPSARVGGVPPELDELCARLLAIEPAGRGSALALSGTLESYLEGDREKEAREALARELLASASACLSQQAADAGARVEAMREALKALALTPDDAAAQKMLLSLVVDGSDRLPPAAEREFEEAEAPAQVEVFRFALLGSLVWLTSFPVCVAIGILSWTVALVSLGLALSLTGYLGWLFRNAQRERMPPRGAPIPLALATAVMIMLSSAWLGPFILTPLNGAVTMVLFTLYASRAERPWILAILSLAVLAPFGIELLHLFPPAYSFAPGELVLHPRLLALPAVPTRLVLASEVSFLLLIGLFVGRLRDRKLAREREMFVQGWHLRQLFPSRGP
jgi:serine/threonine-protein kinase